MLLAWVLRLLDWGHDTARRSLLVLKRFVTRSIFVIGAFVTALWLAVFLYSTFYFLYMPRVSHERPVYFQFRVCESGVGLCSFPVADINLMTDTKNMILRSGQPYRIILEIDLPESSENQKLGMFMIWLKFYNISGDIIQMQSRTAMLHYRSILLQYLNTLFLLPLLLTGVREQKQILSIDMFSKYIDNPYNPAVKAVIEIHNMKIEIYSATIKIYAHFVGLRYLMFNWPVTSAILGITTILVFLGFVAFLSWYHLLHDRYQQLVFITSDNNQKQNMEERRKAVQARLNMEKQKNQSAISTKEKVDELFSEPEKVLVLQTDQFSSEAVGNSRLDSKFDVLNIPGPETKAVDFLHTEQKEITGWDDGHGTPLSEDETIGKSANFSLCPSSDKHSEVRHRHV